MVKSDPRQPQGGSKMASRAASQTLFGKSQRVKTQLVKFRKEKGTYPRHQNYYMQLFWSSGITFLMITITITFLNL